MKIVFESFVIILSTLIVFVILNSPLISYMSIILGLLILILILELLIRKKRKQQELFVGSYFQIFLVISIILLSIFITEGINSAIFFLLYFLLFGITVMYEPMIIFVFLACMLFLFGQQALENQIFSNMLKLGSLLLLSPLAYFFGREFKKKESQK